MTLRFSPTPFSIRHLKDSPGRCPVASLPQSTMLRTFGFQTMLHILFFQAYVFSLKDSGKGASGVKSRHCQFFELRGHGEVKGVKDHTNRYWRTIVTPGEASVFWGVSVWWFYLQQEGYLRPIAFKTFSKGFLGLLVQPSEGMGLFDAHFCRCQLPPRAYVMSLQDVPSAGDGTSVHREDLNPFTALHKSR